jgi:hypothetical protein
MTEQANKQPIKVIIDKTQVERDLADKLNEANRQIGSLEEANRALLNQDRKEFIPTIEPKKPNALGETATLYEPEPEKHVFKNVDASTIPLEWVHGKSDIEVLAITKDLADKGNVDAKKAIRTITRRSFKDGLNMEFRGSIVDFSRPELPVNDSMSIEEQERRKRRNSFLRENRCRWVDLNREGEA